MNIDYQRWYSPSLNQDMEMKIYGHAGKPMLVFPAQGGRFFEFEDFGMIQAVEWFIESGKVTVFTVDSIDGQSWANFSAHPADRARRHEDYDRYIINEVEPLMRSRCPGRKALATGVSMGGYHSANFFFRHPQIFNAVISLSGLMQVRHFIGEYMNDNVYFNSPLNYLSNLEDVYLLNLYRQSQIIICSGTGAWEDEMVADLNQLRWVLETKGIPAWIDLWGGDVNHDWPWWRKQLPYFLGQLQGWLDSEAG